MEKQAKKKCDCNKGDNACSHLKQRKTRACQRIAVDMYASTSENVIDCQIKNFNFGFRGM